MRGKSGWKKSVVGVAVGSVAAAKESFAGSFQTVNSELLLQKKKKKKKKERERGREKMINW